MTKRFLAILLAGTVLLFSFTGCGSNTEATDQENDVSAYSEAVSNVIEDIESVSESKNEEVTEDVSEVTSSEKETLKVSVLDKSRGFHNGVAWVETYDALYIVDAKGEIVKAFDGDYRNYTVVTDFIGGYSILDKSPDLRNDNLVYNYSDHTIVVNEKGEIVFECKAEDHNSFFMFDGLEDGLVVYKKNIDGFEKSGDYYYQYDLNSNIETEICSCDDAGYEKGGLTYVKGGYYITSGKGDNKVAYGNRGLNIEFFNPATGDRISFNDNKTLIDALGEREDTSWYVLPVSEDSAVAVIGYTSTRGKCFQLDLKKGECKEVIVSNTDEKKAGKFFNFIVPEYNTLIYTGYSDAEGPVYYDYSNNKTIVFKPDCDYKCEVIYYENEHFLVTSENQNETLYYTVIGYDMKPLFTPKKYYETTSLVENYIVSDDEDGSVTITDISSNNKEIAKIDSSNICYVDRSNSYVWVITNNNETVCYDIKTGDEICKLIGQYTIMSDFSDGYVLVHNTSDSICTYMNNKGEELTIEK